MILETLVLNPPSQKKRGRKKMAKKKKWYGNPRTKKRAKRRPAAKPRKKTVRGKNWKQFSKAALKKGHSMKKVGAAWRSGKVVGGKQKYKRNPGVKRYTLARSAAPNKRRKPAKRRKKYTRKKKYSRNTGVYRYTIAPVAANPFSRNKGVAAGAIGLVKQTIGSPAFWMHTIAPFAGGFFGSKLVSYQLANLILGEDDEKKAKYWDKPHMKALWQGGTGVVAGIALGLATRKPDISVKIIAGSTLAALLTLLEGQEFYQTYTGMNGLEGLGADVSDELKRKIATSIQEEISSAEGVSDFVTMQSEEGVGVEGLQDFVTMPEVPEELEGISLSSW